MRRFALLLVLLLAATTATITVPKPARATQLHRCPRTYVHDIYRQRHQCLSVAKRKHLYYMLAWYQDRGYGNQRSYSVVSRRFRVSVRALRRIAAEGALKHWPLPPLP